MSTADPGNIEEPRQCANCNAEFGIQTFKHCCKRCKKLFCNKCTQKKCFVPKSEFPSIHPSSWYNDVLAPELENDYRVPHRVCDNCFMALLDLQDALKASIAEEENKDKTEAEKIHHQHLPSTLDFNLEQGIQEAIAITNNFKTTCDGQDIPRGLFALTKGVVFLTVVKGGLIVSGKFGTGLVLARLPNGRWSAPSALQMAGAGFGLQIGGDVTTVMLIIANEDALEAFKTQERISLSTEFHVSAGHVGRSSSGETGVSRGQQGTAVAFSYAQTKGLFLGACIAASGISVRNDVNHMFYGEEVPVGALLNGAYPCPKAADPLYHALDDLLTSGLDNCPEAKAACNK